MKLKALRLRNFGSFKEFEIIFNKTVTRLVGINGSGKTTVGLTGILAALFGIAENTKPGQIQGQRFRFIGKNSKTSNAEVIIYDDENDNEEINVSNTISAGTNAIQFVPENPDYHFDKDWLNNVFGVAFLSTTHFCSLSPMDQSKLLGIDVSKYDNELADLKEEARSIRASLKVYDGIEEMEEVKRVDIDKLKQDKVDLIEKRNKELSRIQSANDALRKEYFEAKQDAIDKMNEYNKKQRSAAEKIKYIDAIIIDMESLGMPTKLQKDLLEWRKSLPKLLPLKEEPDHVPEPVLKSEYLGDTELKELDEKISNAYEQNQRAGAYERNVNMLSAKDELKKKLQNNLEEQKKVVENRQKYMQEFDFGVKNLSVDEKGGLLYKERHLQKQYHSRGELEMVCAGLHTYKNPKIKWRFIDDFESLDEANQEKILKRLLDKGFQVIVAEVGNEPVGDNSILLRDCEIAGEDEKEELI